MLLSCRTQFIDQLNVFFIIGIYIALFVYITYGATVLGSTFETAAVLSSCHCRAKFIGVRHSSSTTFGAGLTFNSSRKFRIVQICGTFRLQRIKAHAPRVRFLLIYRFVQTFLLFQRFLFLLRRLKYNRNKTKAATLRGCHCTSSAILQI